MYFKSSLCSTFRQFSILVSILGLGVAPALAWGPTGHRVVGEIAQRYLSDSALERVREILGRQGLAQVSTWSDEVRSDPRWFCAAPFHYVTVPAGTHYPDSEFADWDEGDALRAVLYLSQRLSSPDVELSAKADALRFLVHILSDLHQPLHIGGGCDRGGNDLVVEWFGEERRLHAIWDEDIIASQDLSFTEYVSFLDPGDREAIRQYQQAGPADWIREAQQLQESVYRCSVRDRCPCFCGDCRNGWSWFGGCRVMDGCRLQVNGAVRFGFNYRARNRPLVERQLVKAGARLAGLLNAIFSNRPGLPARYAELARELERIPDWSAPLAACFSLSDSEKGDF